MLVGFAPLLAMRHDTLIWKWCGTDYDKNTTSNPDKKLLEFHAEALIIWLTHCPTGYPSKVQARTLILWLNSKYAAMLTDVPQDWLQLTVEERANKAASRWKLMLKHCVELRFPRLQDYIEPIGPFPRLKEALELIQPGRKSAPSADPLAGQCQAADGDGDEQSGGDEPSGADEPSGGGDDQHELDNLLQAIRNEEDRSDAADEAENDLECIGVKCCCPDCLPPFETIRDDERDDEASASSERVADSGYVDPRKGPNVGQKQETIVVRKLQGIAKDAVTDTAAATERPQTRSRQPLLKHLRQPRLEHQKGRRSRQANLEQRGHQSRRL